MAVFDFSTKDALEGVFFRFVDDGLAGEGAAFFAGDLGDGAFGREVTTENAQMAVSLDGIGEGADNVLVRSVVPDVS